MFSRWHLFPVNPHLVEELVLISTFLDFPEDYEQFGSAQQEIWR